MTAIFLAFGTNLYGQTRADEMVEMWNQVGNKIIAMAKDFPANKYDFKVQPDRRGGLRPGGQSFGIANRARFRQGQAQSLARYL